MHLTNGGRFYDRSAFSRNGSSGIHGKFTVDELLRNGKKVRAFVHKEDARSEALVKQGAEIHVGDLYNFESARAALEGVTAAYFTMSVSTDLIPAAAFFAQASKEAGLKALVNMSQISARREAKSHTAFNHWIAERIFDWAGTPVIHLRPTFFAQWILYPFIREQIISGSVEWGWSMGKHAPIAAEDQARLIAAVLQNPGPHLGKTYPLYGPKEYTAAELFVEISRVLGREVKYTALTNGAFKKKLSGLPQVFAQHVEEVTKDHTNGIFAGTDSVIEKVTGTPPMGVEEFVKRNRASFDRVAGE
jgi:uncharacterized protein YbjT (DUF2867 family)